MAKAQLSAGMTIDGFVLQERIHRGGMATIWRVARDDIDTPIVMKVPFLDYEGDLSLLVGFEVEQMIMAELAGPHVPRWIANGDFTAQPYIVMEYVPGPTLLRRLLDQRLRLEEAVRLGIAIADALSDLHAQHVLHLDLKPANILFRPGADGGGEAVLIDFGLSRHEQLPDLLEEQFHRPTGTPEYMAPEQLLRVRSDRRSDVFALGAILYQMATGEPPFGTPGRMAQVRERVWRDPVPPRARNPEIAPALQETILKCLEPLPDRRPATAEELAFDLRHPDLVVLTERAARTARTGFGATLRRRLAVGRTMRAIQAAATRPLPGAPIILVAVDLRPGLDELQAALLEAAVSVLANMPGARLACLNVMQTSLIAIDDNVDKAGENIHVQRMAALRRWAQPLGLPRGKVTYHLVESRNIAAGILDFARSNKVDHLVIGAPATGVAAASRLTAQITTEAPCTVTVVRVAVPRAAAGEEAAAADTGQPAARAV
jgi:nucleotide-binding universal stress UspA family protein